MAQLAKDPYQNYWKYVPEDMQPKLHFYNFAISSNHDSPSYPMNIIRNIYRPGTAKHCVCLPGFMCRILVKSKHLNAQEVLVAAKLTANMPAQIMRR